MAKVYSVTDPALEIIPGRLTPALTMALHIRILSLKTFFFPRVNNNTYCVFSDPQSWFMARLAYIRTTATMSMVGYLLGLGDRHGENILFDTTNGDTIHVDLNMLFDKGHQLRVPETVPFRLTQNMVQAMGPTGTEGPFR